MSAASSDTSAVSPAPSGQPNHGCLPRGFRLREFVIERVLGDGGFGVVYSALDLRLERRVAIKEYMPSSLATRATDYSVQMLTSQRHRDAFEIGLRSFINEARLLARFEHPALVKVHQFWQEKGTAYMVMPFYSAPTLRAWIRGRTEPVSEAWLRSFLLAAMEAVEVLHAESCLHRDIAPDNILVLKDAAPLLLDFGAARRVIGDLRKALTVIVKPGFAPLEQYADTVKMKQGPWSDVYALAAVAHYALTGQAPAPAVSRVLADEVVPLRLRLKGQYSDALLGAIDTALAVKPERRPQTIAAFRSLLDSDQAGEWEPTRLIVRAPVGSDTHQSIVAATDAAHMAAARSEGDAPRTAAPRSVQRTAAPATARPQTAARVKLSTEATTLQRLAQSHPNAISTLVDAVRTRVSGSARHSRWLGVAGYAGVLLAFGGVLALTAYGLEAYVDASTNPRTAAAVIERKTEPAPQPAPAPAPVAERAAALNGTEAMVEAKPAEVTLAPAKIDARSLPPVAPAPAPAPVASASTAKPKATSQPKPSTVDRTQRETGSAALLLTASAPAPTATRPATATKTRGLDEMVAPLERAAEVTHVAAVETVVAPPTEPAPRAPQAVERPQPEATPRPLRLLERPQPEFPVAALKEGIRDGRVLAQLSVNSDGSVGRVDIVDAQPRNVFDKEVRRALSSWRYEAPGQQRQATVELVFKLDQ
ncbi:MAG TPA: TonB family protein [Burkholderiaceae bacterium]|nr:TonB family protein [Burkholderiaceae bacterium]